jgi:deazaflavin-dependent oxidoreductase (nitroreductase family)
MAGGDGDAVGDEVAGAEVAATEAEAAKERKRRRVRFMQRYVANPLVKPLTHLGLLPNYVVLETTGRRSGRPRTTVVGVHPDPDGDASAVWIVAEHGHRAAYVRNIEAEPAVRIRRRRRWHPGRAEVVDHDPEALLATSSRSLATAIRRFGTDLLSIRVHLDPPG